MAVDPLIAPETSAPSWRRRELVVVLAIWAIASALVAVLAFGVVTPRRFIDEFLYWALAKNFAAGAGLSWRGSSVVGGSSIYPVVIAPAFKLASSVGSQYDLARTINSALICAVVFPVYVGARWFVSQRLALLAAVFALSVPALNYAGIVGTESLAYPLAAAAFVGMLRSLARPGWRSAVIAIGLTLLAVASRMQFVLLLPIFAGTLGLVALMRGPGERMSYLRAQRALISMLAALALLGAIYILIRGRASLGIYQSLADQSTPSLGTVWFWFKAFAADVYLLCAMVPAIATFALLGSRVNRRDPLIGALAALALVASIAFVLQMTWFSAISIFDWREQHVFYERYMFYLGPLFFIGLVASFGRVAWKAAAVSVGVAVLIVSGMQSDAINVPFSLDAFGQAYLGFYLDGHDSALPHVGMLLAGLTLIFGLVYVASAAPEGKSDLARYGKALAIGLSLFVLVISQAKAWSYQQLYSESLRAQEPTPLDWVARATPQSVAMLLAFDADPTTFYETEFWNPNVDRAYVTPVSPVDSHPVYSPTCLFAVMPPGKILQTVDPGCASVPTAWLVESDSFSMHLRDETRRVHPSTGIRSTLMLAKAPARVLSQVGGRDVRTGLVDEELGVRVWSEESGRVRIVAKATRGPVVLTTEDGARFTIAAGESVTFGFGTVPGVRHEIYKLKGGITSPDDLKVSKIEFREGDEPWRNIN